MRRPRDRREGEKEKYVNERGSVRREKEEGKRASL
jgi:hypothetical protein